jgi:hypothetical protein
VDEQLKRAIEKVIQDYQDYQDYMATLGGWEGRAKNMTPVEIFAAFKKECELVRRVQIVERFLKDRGVEV